MYTHAVQPEELIGSSGTGVTNLWASMWVLGPQLWVLSKSTWCSYCWPCLQCAPGLRHSSLFSLSHQGELVYPKALQAPQELGEPQLLLPPRFLHFLCYLVSHESLWCWTPSPGGKAQTWLHPSRNQVHSRPVVWEPSLGQGTPLSPPATALLLSLCSCSFGWHWISASKTTI